MKNSEISDSNAPNENIQARVDAYIENQAQLDLLRFITCGSVDDGKSTLIGRMLFEAQLIFEDQITSLKSDSKKVGTQGGDIDFALLVDGLAAEREQGITIDVAYRFFNTDRRKFIVADTPGHEQYTRNMVTGASTADVAIILVDASQGILTQTRRHSFIASLLGIQHVVLAVNKMDLVDFDRNRFDAIVADYETLRDHFNFASVTPIPLSALQGDNVIERSKNTDWYSGPTLLGFLETVRPGRAELDAPFRFPVQWVNRPNADFRGYSGTIASGQIKPGDRVVALPSEEIAHIESICLFDQELAQGFTHQGQVLGAGVGPSGNQQDFKILLIDHATQLKYGFSLRRVVHNNDYLYITFIDLDKRKRYWTDLSMGLEAGGGYKRFILEGQLTYIYALNYQWELLNELTGPMIQGNNQTNIFLGIKTIYQF